VTGRNIRAGATVSVGGRTPKKVKFLDLDTQTNAFTKLTLKGKFCAGLPGVIIVTNPEPTGGSSEPFQCNERCPSQ
jgi:hypothetical protein